MEEATVTNREPNGTAWLIAAVLIEFVPKPTFEHVVGLENSGRADGRRRQTTKRVLVVLKQHAREKRHVFRVVRPLAVCLDVVLREVENRGLVVTVYELAAARVPPWNRLEHAVVDAAVGLGYVVAD